MFREDLKNEEYSYKNYLLKKFKKGRPKFDKLIPKKLDPIFKINLSLGIEKFEEKPLNLSSSTYLQKQKLWSENSDFTRESVNFENQIISNENSETVGWNRRSENEEIERNLNFSEDDDSEIFDRNEFLSNQCVLSRKEIEGIKVLSGLIKGDCSICQEEFKGVMAVNKLPCGHLFHKECLVPWFKDSSHCPNCRFDLFAFFRK